MSYCVNCGVELADNQEDCPLCGVQVINPADPDRRLADPAFPPDPSFRNAAPRIRRAAVMTAAVIGLIPLLTALACDLAFNGVLTWSRYVGVSFLIAYVFLFPPMLIKKHRVTWSMALDYAVMALGMWLFCLIVGGKWYLPFALPLVTVVFALAYTVYLLIRHTPWNFLKIASVVSGGMGLFALLVEWLINSAFLSGKPMFWSLITAIPCAILCAAGTIVECSPELKQYIKRRFFI